MQRILITGGLGFVGSHLALNYLNKGEYEVILFDNLSDESRGALRNFYYLTRKCREKFQEGILKIVPGDVRNFDAIKEVMKDVDVIIHTAAQVSMIPSIKNPTVDFEINCLGSFNVLEAARRSDGDPILGYTSTNKVYGTLEKLQLVSKEKRWDYPEGSAYYNGIMEDQPLDLGGPYGCSKAVGDLYFREYHRTYGMKTFVFRMSSIYGELQYTMEVHGWIGWILSRALHQQPVTVYGDGKQVRGILYVKDLAQAFELAVENVNKTAGEAFNMGGNRENSLSILELLELLKKMFNIAPSKVEYSNWRKVDQKCFIPNCRKALEYFGWKQEVSKEEGIRRMYEWMRKPVN